MIDKVLLPNVPSSPNVSSIGSKDNANKANAVANNGKSFESYLQEAESTSVDNGIKFSAHAMARMNSRNINLSPEEVTRLAVAAEKASTKGGKDTLVLLNGSGFIVDNRTKTVVTAMDMKAMKENVFTNIDTAVLG